ncbi:depupylase/deamidase Dop [Varibaculum cambriense]|uniref:depupylase/deamidase Dop n=2 Tax=Varibaculum cambriense TaxID=184870 RepID=UPI00290034AF|nr:depupylase/deamidase Dop [Varibaculum cambriense]MDU1224497.1 depupylase/deamidase Dop [Varibaculum cambriense]
MSESAIKRPLGTETEFGIIQVGNVYANPVALSTQVVAAYRDHSRTSEAVTWDYEGENPLQDMRGFSLNPREADPSQLTNNPEQLAPAGPGVQAVARPSAQEAALPKPSACVLTNGARLYVDHAHPEYSSPETLGPKQGALYDAAGDLIARRAMELAAASGNQIELFKNNVDGKGAAYGSHENYLLRRDLEFFGLAQNLIPFLVTRPIICGAGRVGIGQRSEKSGFQVSQRADYVENDIGLETTFNRPIVNTRDEPHADASRWRRLHVIGGDANRYQYSTYLRLGSTAALLWLLENPDCPQVKQLEELRITSDPVEETWAVSHDLSLTHRIETVSGPLSALQIQKAIRVAIAEALEERGEADQASAELLKDWQQVLDSLATDRQLAARRVEWVGKYQLLARMRQRLGCDWNHPKIQALDLQWAALRPGIFENLCASGMVEQLFSAEEVSQAVSLPPRGGRSWVRGMAVANLPEVKKGSWESLLLDLGGEQLLRFSLGDPARPASPAEARALENGDAAAFARALSGEKEKPAEKF